MMKAPPGLSRRNASRRSRVLVAPSAWHALSIMQTASNEAEGRRVAAKSAQCMVIASPRGTAALAARPSVTCLGTSETTSTLRPG